MAKLPAKFEDWTPPWEEGDFDEDRAARLIFNALRGQEKAKTQAAEHREQLETVTAERDQLQVRVDSAGGTDTEIQAKLVASETTRRDLEKKLEKLSDRDEVVAERDRLAVAIDKGLTKRQAMRLRGKDLDELAEDADSFLEELGKKPADDGDEREQRRGGEPEQDFGGGRIRRQSERSFADSQRDGGPPARGQMISVEQAMKDGDDLFGPL